MSKRHRRPTGEVGPQHITQRDGKTVVTWHRIEFPAEKKNQEELVAAAFIQELNKNNPGVLWRVERLPEDDFDFLLCSENDRRYLDLQEIVIPPRKRGSPYASREQVIQSGKFADTITSEIRRKAYKYSGKLECPLDLLIYATYWRFLCNQKVLQIVAHALRTNSHPFAMVHWLTLIDDKTSQATVVFPNNDLLRDFNEAVARATRYVNFDPASVQPVTNMDGSVGAKFALTPETWKKLSG